MDQIGFCWKCKNSLTFLDYGRKDSCRVCSEDTHVCVNCIYYDESFYQGCRETQAERVLDKQRSNFCDYFKPKNFNSINQEPQKDLKAAAEALFKKK